MKISVISFTEQGEVLSIRLAKQLKEYPLELYTKCSRAAERQSVFRVEERLSEWSEKQFAQRNALLFIGSCGIAVRAIAPFVKDKLTDSPVLVMDETGKFLIPLLSGHVGGANELATQIAAKTGAVPVITTATDGRHLFAADVFAEKNRLRIENKEGIAQVSAKILSGEVLTIAIEGWTCEEMLDKELPGTLQPVPYPPMQLTDIVIATEKEALTYGVLKLRPREYVLGVGCKKGKTFREIAGWIACKLLLAGITVEDVAMLASIDRKKEEDGLVEWAASHRIPFVTFTEEQLNRIDGNFHGSDFVKNQVGVDNVCERAAMAAGGKNGRIVMEKQAENGMTLAIVKREWSVTFEEL